MKSCARSQMNLAWLRHYVRLPAGMKNKHLWNVDEEIFIKVFVSPAFRQVWKHQICIYRRWSQGMLLLMLLVQKEFLPRRTHSFPSVWPENENYCLTSGKFLYWEAGNLIQRFFVLFKLSPVSTATWYHICFRTCTNYAKHSV